MPRTLRQHLQEAMDYMRHTHGYCTFLPTKEPPAPVRIDERNRRLVYAVSVIRVVEKYDRTGYAMSWLMVSDDVAGEAWAKIPEHLVCPLCLGRVCGDTIIPGRRALCRPCGEYVRPKSLRGLVSSDLRRMGKALRDGEIPCKKERGERE